MPIFRISLSKKITSVITWVQFSFHKCWVGIDIRHKSFSISQKICHFVKSSFPTCSFLVSHCFSNVVSHFSLSVGSNWTSPKVDTSTQNSPLCKSTTSLLSLCISESQGVRECLGLEAAIEAVTKQANWKKVKRITFKFQLRQLGIGYIKIAKFGNTEHFAGHRTSLTNKNNLMPMLMPPTKNCARDEPIQRL